MKKQLTSCAQGRVKPLSHVNDPVFSSKMIGDGVAITPTHPEIVSPCDGIVSMVFPTQHAFGISSEGIDILIHIGIDTVSLQGKHFKALIKEGDHVQAHQVCVVCDFKEIQEAGLSIDTMMIISNKPEDVEIVIHDETRDVSIHDTLITWSK
ncbi:MAG: PTS glucose transporter subunit IIA [Erysipelotrichia bacterium]|jgi:glucose-specific phosphotransferase system IIA component|nr:PTS glucose transporter subunit IIA [Erysipelotrichia bacterium]